MARPGPARKNHHQAVTIQIAPIVGLVAAALLLCVGCATAPGNPMPTPAKPVLPTMVFAALAMTPTAEPTPQSPCVPLTTPQPAPTPSANAPAPAFKLSAPFVPVLTGLSELRDVTFYSAHLDKQMPFLIYLPPGYADTTRRYPVLYMLSGFAGDRHEWVNWGICEALEQLVRGEYIQPLIVVMPEGDHSWWFNHASVPGSDGKAYGDYVWDDVVKYIDANFRTIANRTSRAIGGLSAGGQSAFALALTHPEVFSIAGAHSPSIRHADGSLAFFGDQAYFNQYDPSWLFPHTDTWKTLTLWMDVGDDDTQWGDSIHQFHNMLVDLSVPHDFQDKWDGIHDDYYWGAHIPDYLIWYASKLEGEESR